MNERRVPSFVLVVTFICALLAGTSEAGRRIAESFFGKNIQEIDEDTAEQLWVHCREELLEISDDFKYIDLYIPHTTSSSENKVNSDIGLLTKRIIHKAIIDLPPQVKHNLLDCLNEENSPSLYSGKESGLINWLNNWRELLSDWFSGPRRYLLRNSHPKNHKHKHTHKHKHKHKHRRGKHKAAPRPAEAPTPASASPAFAPAPLYLVPASSPYPAEAPDFTASPNPAEAPDSTESPTPALVSPAFTPAPLYLVPASSPTPTVHSTVKVPEPSLPPVVKNSPPPVPAMRHPQPHAAPHKPSKSKANSKESNTAVIGASSTAAFALIALFFCCCLRRRRNRIGPRDRQRDDKPLLNFCSSNHSAGSSQTSHGLENSSRKDFSSSSNVNNLPIRSGTALAEGQLLDAMKGASGVSHAPLPLPPGRTAPPHGISTAPPGKSAPPPPKPPPPPPPPPAPKAPASRAPPPPKVGHLPPPNPPKPGSSGRTSLLGPHSRGRSSVGEETNKTSASDSQKAKLKPFFWDKVLAKPDQSMVWHDLKAGSFQFNEEMMENLFGYNTVEKNKNDRNCKRDPSTFEAPQYIQIIDTRKAQNLSILLRALNVTTEEVCEAVMEGNELPTELIQTLLKMAPTTEEELKLRLYSGDLSQLGPAERFLKVLVDIPFAFKRLESLLFMCSIQEEASTLKESFAVLEVACKELKNSRVFLKLLEAVLKTGNRMNDGTYRGGAQAFKLDTLLKLSDVKGIDGKTTLLHFVVLEIIRSEGIRAARRARENHSITSVKTEDLLEDSTQESSEYHRSLGLEVVSNLSNELANVRKAAAVDGDTITATVSRLGHSLKISKDFLNNEMNSVGDECEFRDTLTSFVEQAEDDIIWILEEEKKITSLVKSTADYFHGTQGKDEGLRLFMIVRDFLVMVDKVCQEVKNSATNPIKIPKKEAPPSTTSPSGESHQPPSPPAIKERRKDDSSSDDESSSP